MVDFVTEKPRPSGRRKTGVVDLAQKEQSRRDFLKLGAGVGLLSFLMGAGLAKTKGGEDLGSGVGVTLGTNAKAAEPNVQLSPQEATKPETAKPLFDIVFHDLDSNQEAQASAEVEAYEVKIKGKENYIKLHREIPEKYKNLIELTAKAYGITPDALAGIISVENGGGEDVTNPVSRARGVMQLLSDTAREMGLTVNDKVDQRAIPGLAIPAGARYLESLKNLFAGDEGLMIWAYHAGPGNVFNALRIYFKDVNNTDIRDYAGAIEARDSATREYAQTKANRLIKQDKLDIFKLFSNAKTREFVEGLKDFSIDYPGSVVAASKLLHEQTGNSPPLIF